MFTIEYFKSLRDCTEDERLRSQIDTLVKKFENSNLEVDYKITCIAVVYNLDCVVKFLLENGCNDHLSFCAMLNPVREGHLEILKLLLQYGNRCEMDTCLENACKDPRNYESAKLLLEHNAPITKLALEFAIDLTSPEMVKLLLDHGADVSDSYLFTSACHKRCIKTCQYLLEAGLIPEFEYALYGACRGYNRHDSHIQMNGSCEEIIDFLLNNGCDPNILDEYFIDLIERTDGFNYLKKLGYFN